MARKAGETGGKLHTTKTPPQKGPEKGYARQGAGVAGKSSSKLDVQRSAAPEKGRSQRRGKGTSEFC